ncbi:uncharacterized protein EV420DRAFT_1478219 [Desarmillaria tabescens]|uniref:Uncharacterized protein n=1 Tax=Armillaria tabescens TaxID=1929756 RepID=A0AA39N7G5_ARMTA|nr:uncharacterized protein EV420DRAFT_1478219 [Desarmillaria tabescens]KAK0460432.1 hypothetical protein EV420DRAFT_1478219 [Desarmillaria tabescens]
MGVSDQIWLAADDSEALSSCRLIVQHNMIFTFDLAGFSTYHKLKMNIAVSEKNCPAASKLILIWRTSTVWSTEDLRRLSIQDEHAFGLEGPNFPRDSVSSSGERDYGCVEGCEAVGWMKQHTGRVRSTPPIDARFLPPLAGTSTNACLVHSQEQGSSPGNPVSGGQGQERRRVPSPVYTGLGLMQSEGFGGGAFSLPPMFPREYTSSCFGNLGIIRHYRH